MATILAILFGAIVGGLWDRSFSVLTGAALGFLLLRTFRLQRQVALLQLSLDEAVSRATAQASGAAPQAPRAADEVTRPAAPVPTHEAKAKEPAETVGELLPSARRPETIQVPPPAPPARALQDLALAGVPPVVQAAPLATISSEPDSPATPPDVAAAGRVADAYSDFMGWLLGGNTIVKVGIGILFVGLAFLAKYASDRDLIPVELRLLAIAGAALALLGVGWYLRLKRPGYSQILQGGAVAVLYLTLFAAFKFYKVLDVGPAFVLMVAVAALAAALAILQDARPLAVIGALGGFATPLLLSTGGGSHVALFSYYLVLDLGIAAVAWHTTWRSLNLVGFTFTFLVGTAWGVLKYEPSHYWSSQAFLVAFFLLFAAIMLMPARRQARGEEAARDPHAWVNGTLLFGLPTIAFALQYGLVRDTQYGAALAGLALAVFYVMLAAWARAHRRLALVFEGSLAIGTVFTALIIPFALDARSTAGAWALEGAGLVWLGFRQSRTLARAFGYALLLLAGGSLAIGLAWHGRPDTFFDATFFNAIMLAAGALAAAQFVHRSTTRPDASSAPTSGAERTAEPVLIGWATWWLTALIVIEIDAFVTASLALAAWLSCASLVALVYVGLSRWLEWRRVSLPVVAHAPLMALATAISAFSNEAPIDGGGWWAWPLALGTHAVVLALAAPQWSPGARSGAHVLGCLVVAALGALEGRAITAHWGSWSSAWPWLGWLAVPALLLLLLPRPKTAARWPVSAAPRAYQTVAAAVLTLGLLGWTLIAAFASDGSAEPLPYVPMLNPLDLGVAVALYAAWQWMRSGGAREVASATPRRVQVLVAVAGFVSLNAMLLRGFHHYGGVGYSIDRWMESLPVQTGITLLWTATALALMWLAARRATRGPWMAGAALLAAVVVKLATVDLSGSGTVMRIVSFIGVGVLMLVIGYVAPLPGKGDRDAAA